MSTTRGVGSTNLHITLLEAIVFVEQWYSYYLSLEFHIHKRYSLSAFLLLDLALLAAASLFAELAT